MSEKHWAGKTIVVTGGLGFIGSHFVERLLEYGANVACIHRGPKPEVLKDFLPADHLRLLSLDLLDYAGLSAAIRSVTPRVDMIVHCAALYGNAEFKKRNPATILDANMRMASNVLEVARAHEIGDVVMMGSAEMYSELAPSPAREDDDYRRFPVPTQNGYALAKIYTEMLADVCRTQYGMRIFVPRPTNVYGPRDDFDACVSRVVPRLMNRIARGEDIEIWGDGSQTRTFIHAGDVVRTTLRMVELNRHHTLNIGTREEISILALARMLSSAFGGPECIRLVPEMPIGPGARTLDVSRMDELIDFEPTTLRDGLEETVRWYRRTMYRAATAR
ncbi:NAD-dependent epimerase/dehydratase family protein [Streptomyces sp. NBC_01435]|uniref:NAD-dependent epimerase/dehydratase family protein n=1 Tax=Streptomyces sp. NBC_01435 TaxID=2903865 RepID=UPI002E2F11BB|nr:SDR family NAD(P)-dependent oxidoreductase [Streptomyces sp. NBC_01435]